MARPVVILPDSDPMARYPLPAKQQPFSPKLVLGAYAAMLFNGMGYAQTYQANTSAPRIAVATPIMVPAPIVGKRDRTGAELFAAAPLSLVEQDSREDVIESDSIDREISPQTVNSPSQSGGRHTIAIMQTPARLSPYIASQMTPGLIETVPYAREVETSSKTNGEQKSRQAIAAQGVTYVPSHRAAGLMESVPYTISDTARDLAHAEASKPASPIPPSTPYIAAPMTAGLIETVPDARALAAQAVNLEPAVQEASPYRAAPMTDGLIESVAQVPAPPEPSPPSFEDLGHWWKILNCPELDPLISHLVHQSPALGESYRRVQEARALYARSKSEFFPDINATNGYGYNRFSKNGNAFVQQSGSTTGFDLYSAGFDASWEIDLFGRLRNARDAAGADTSVAIEDYRGVMVSLVAETVQAFVQLRLAERRLQIAQENLQSQQDTVEIVRVRQQAGFVGELDVRQAEAQMHLTAATIPDLDSDRIRAFNRLSVLQGISPGTANWQLAPGAIPRVDPRRLGSSLHVVPVARPDVRSARFDMAAARSRVSVAEAARYPQLSLDADVGVNSRRFDSWFENDSLNHRVGPELSWNVLNFGRLRSDIRAAEARYCQAVARYQQTVLAASEEVENAIAQLNAAQLRAESLHAAASAAQHVSAMAAKEYVEGLTSFQTVLDTQRQQLVAESQLAVAHADSIYALVAYFKALGGGTAAH